MTFVCPRCGFADPPFWRQNRWVSSVSYCRIEDFQEYPDYSEFKDIRPGQTVSDKYCYYYRGKKQHLYVYRWLKILGPEYYPRTRHLLEHHVPRGIPCKNQKTLEIGALAPIAQNTRAPTEASP
jgi:hypothetical protein